MRRQGYQQPTALDVASRKTRQQAGDSPRLARYHDTVGRVDGCDRDAVGKRDDGFGNLELSTVSGSAVPRIGDLDILLAWNAADPVDAFEMRRNDRIHAQWQGNRNPFIDHPEWAAAIWN